MLSLYVKLQVALNALMSREEGQDLVEYALIIALVSLAVVAGLTGLAGGISATYARVVTALTAAGT